MKNSVTIILSSLFFIVLSFSFLGCEKEKYKQYCTGPILDFKMEQMSSFYPDSLLECTKCRDGYIKFSMIDSTAELIKWTVGNDAREFTNRSFSLFFEDMVGRTIPITLYVEKFVENEDADCDITYYRDTITKTLEFISYFDCQIFGKYRGYSSDNPNEELTVELFDTLLVTDPYDASLCLTFVQPPLAYGVMRGIPKTCRDVYSCHGPILTPAYDKFYFDTRGLSDECLEVHGRGYLDKNNHDKITIFYKTFVEIDGFELIEKERKFVGYRID